ncbi:hypothetical protein JET14_05990 [Martelella lutilitoris]|uniref:Rad50/SbcC-type AAA domain-containing protein n=1 Tax=Martelella lutilitoris TaxID=2583532 RepID=A0A7T7HM22_9HYPH|nr:AAA family ATPase [Martelella lutilitoris]QQM31718.1 hypothetical protein JET14_05990 [Martelella lutilitoris]
MAVLFPTFQSLDIENYLLYPGTEKTPGLKLKFGGGPWIILGVNGLGKSTLLLVLKHILLGAVSLRPPGFGGERADIVAADKRMFAVRVSDGAKNATAQAEIRFGPRVLRVKRSLNDLSLISAEIINAQNESIASELDYQTIVATLMGVSRFEDAVRILERVTFFLETRETLVWNSAAQFEVFRAILTPENSGQLRELEKEIVSSDSAARNINAALTRLVKRREKISLQQASEVAVRAELSRVAADLDRASKIEITRQLEFDECEQRRTDARLALKRIERDVDDTALKYERLKFDLLRHSFAELPPSDQYVLMKLVSEHKCLACGEEHADAAAAELEERQKDGQCLVCGTAKDFGENVVVAADALKEKADHVFGELVRLRAKLANAADQFSAAEDEYKEIDNALELSQQKSQTLRNEYRSLVKKLPNKEQSSLSEDEKNIVYMRRQVSEFRRERERAEEKIELLLSFVVNKTEEIRVSIEDKFNITAKDFFAENVRLVYEPRHDRIGQGGRSFEFPAFEVELTSTATEGNFIRRKLSQVSLSQREYLDIIFRLTLMEVLGSGGGTLIFDGPEGSVDAVFAQKAGNLFSKTRDSDGEYNNILACNIVEGGLIPNSLKNFQGMGRKRERIVNLVELGAPTAALNVLRSEYNKIVDDLLKNDPST